MFFNLNIIKWSLVFYGTENLRFLWKFKYNFCMNYQVMILRFWQLIFSDVFSSPMIVLGYTVFRVVWSSSSAQPILIQPFYRDIATATYTSEFLFTVPNLPAPFLPHNLPYTNVWNDNVVIALVRKHPLKVISTLICEFL